MDDYIQLADLQYAVLVLRHHSSHQYTEGQNVPDSASTYSEARTQVRTYSQPRKPTTGILKTYGGAAGVAVPLFAPNSASRAGKRDPPVYHHLMQEMKVKLTHSTGYESMHPQHYPLKINDRTYTPQNPLCDQIHGGWSKHTESRWSDILICGSKLSVHRRRVISFEAYRPKEHARLTVPTGQNPSFRPNKCVSLASPNSNMLFSPYFEWASSGA